MKGTVARFNAKRGFGFIRSDELADELFVHITKVEGRRALRPGQKVTFETETTDKGLAAVNVMIDNADQQRETQRETQQQPGTTSPATTRYLLFAGLAIIVLVILFLLLR